MSHRPGLKRGTLLPGQRGAKFSREREKAEAVVLCAELEELEGEFDHILAELENPDLTEQERQVLEDAKSRLTRAIQEHEKSGHEGGPCFEQGSQF